jgi:uncharacterized protein (DUF1330 family)
MTPAFLIADITLHDPQRYKEYVEKVPAIIASHGGRYLVRGGATDVLEGDWVPSRLIVLQFPDKEAAMRFYRDPRYQALKDIRVSAADAKLVIVEGC